MPDVTAPFGFPYPEDTDLVRDGASDIEALAEGVNDQLALGFVYVGTRYYTSSGTFAKADPFGDSSFAGAKLRALKVTVQGGGGGGASTDQNDSGGAGGGGGGCGIRFITDIAGLDASITVTRGGGGNGGAAGNNNGSAGGSSSFGTLVGATGGGGGSHPNQQFVTGGAGGGPASGQEGDVNFRGSGGLAANLTQPVSGAGGSSHLGGGGFGQGRTDAFSAAGGPGLEFGGGGAGTMRKSSSQDFAGAVGAAGIVIVDVFA